MKAGSLGTKKMVLEMNIKLQRENLVRACENSVGSKMLDKLPGQHKGLR